MSDLATLIANITASTGRSDVDGLITTKINQAIRSMALSDNYEQDIVEVSFTVAGGEIDSAAYVQALPTPSRFRKIAYLLYPEDTSLDPIIPSSVSHLTKAANRQTGNTCYRAGTTIRVRNSTLTSILLLGYYEFPAALVEDADSNWITELNPYMVEDLASIYIHSHIGDKAQANAVNIISRENIAITMHDAISGYAHGVLDK